MTRLVLVLFLPLINVACAYHFGAVKRTIPGNYDRVAVPVFKNLTNEVGVETYFTKSMIEEIERGHIASVTDKEDAQIVIEGEVMGVQYVADGTTKPANLPLETEMTSGYRIIVDTRVQARRKSDKKVIWGGTFQGEVRYPAPLVASPIINTVNPLYNHSARHQNIEIKAREMMAEAYSRMTENF